MRLASASFQPSFVLRFVSRPALLIVSAIAATIVFPLVLSGLSLPAAAQEAGGARPVSAQPLIRQPIDESQLTTLKGNTHPLARPEFDLGTASADLPMARMLLVLKRSPEQEAALGKMLDDQQDKSSPNYHKWLTPDQFGKQFGQTDADMQTIVLWLQSHGFEVGSTKGRTVLEFSGTAAQVQEAFHTSIHSYLVKGEEHWANSSDPQIPTALAGAVAGVASLNNFPRKAMNVPGGKYARDEKTGRIKAVEPQLTFPGNCNQIQECYGVTPYDFATIYNELPLWNAGINGAGVTIAIVGETDIQLSDVQAFRTFFGLPANDPTFILNGPDPGIQGDESEADIDVQWSGGTAPGASIDFVISQSTETTSGVDLSAVYVVEQNLAPIVSESYGFCELGLGTAGNAFYNALWQQASAQGITVFISAGDNGSAGCDNFDAQGPAPAQFGLQVSGYASTPYNVAVGGTDFNDFSNSSNYWNTTNNPTTQQSAKSYIPETTWNDSCTNAIFSTVGFSTNAETNCNNSQLAGFVVPEGGSGGSSTCTSNSQELGTCSGGYARPSWQTGSGTFSSDGKRDIPDVSLFASNGFVGNAYLICEADVPGGRCPYGFLGFGGTSVSSPSFAGIMALVVQKTGERQGNANYVFYKLAAKSGASCSSSSSEASSCIFNDVNTGTIAMPCATGSPNCKTNTNGDKVGVLTGYNAAAGYDLATGLGSVNANNLVNQWSSISSLPSTTTLNNLTPTTITHGQVVNFSVTVKPQSGSGTPSGQIALIGGPSSSKGIGDFALTSGGVSGTTDLLQGGSYSIFAHYPGDATYAPSDSAAVSVNVTAESSKTLPNLVTFGTNGLLTSFSATSATYGSGYYLFRVDVGDSSASVASNTGISSTCAQGKASCPTGKVSIQATGTSLDGSALSLNSEGFAENQNFPPGTYNISASYSGDSSYSGSTGAGSFTIAQAPTVASAGTVALSAQYGNFIQINGYLSTTSDGVAPTGNFQFIQDGSSTGLVSVYESGGYNPSNNEYAWADTSSTTHFNSIGNHTLALQYLGDTNYAPSTSPVVSVVVGQAQPFFNSEGWETYNQSVYVGQTVTAIAQLYGSQYGALPTGTITMYDNGTAFPGSASYSSYNQALVATLSYTFTTAGSHTFSVSYSGDNNYLPTKDTDPFPLTVLGPVSVTPGGTLSITTPGQSGSTILSLTPNQGFTGTVSLSCAPDPLAKESSCGFISGGTTSSTLQVDLGASGATVTFNVTTTGPHAASQNHAAVSVAIAMGGLGIVILPFGGRRRFRACAVATLLLLLVLPGCGGGSNGGGGGGNTDPGTSVGQYTFTVTAVTGSGSSAISAATPVTVVVQ